jgi:integrase
MAHHRAAWFALDTRHGPRRGPAAARQSGYGRRPGRCKAKRQAATVSELCDLYIADAESGRLLTRRNTPKKSSTLVIDRGRIERHIKPLLGQIKVAAITREDVDAFMHDVAAGKTAGNRKTAKKRGLARVRGGKGAASRAVGLLGGIFTYAVKHRMRSDNPVHGLTRFADGKRERRLNDEEYTALGDALRRAEADDIWPPAVAAVRFLALSGWRRSEALGLRWNELDLGRRTATLLDTKTGKSVRPLSHAACELLRDLTRSDELVFPATRGNGSMVGFPKQWAKIRKLGALPSDITAHTLRHSFASLAADLGYSEPTIAALVGHKGRTTTSRYVHAADAVLLSAADAVAVRTAELMCEPAEAARVIPLRAS